MEDKIMNNNAGYAPLVLFVYNRPDHTLRTLQKLNTLVEAKATRLYVFSDQAKNEKAAESVRRVRTIVNDFATNSNFAEVVIREAEENKGLAANIIGGVSEIIEKFGRVIVLEDDLEVSDDFLSFMNGALDYYQKEKKIWAISGYTFPMKTLKNYPHDVYMCGRACSWGWATWADRWKTVDWEVKDYSNFKFNFSRRRAFSRWGVDLPTMLDAYIYGEIHSWAIRWCYEAFKQDRWTVYPVKSRIANHGTDGSGTNFSHAEDRYNTILNDDERTARFEMIEMDEKIRREFSHKFSSSTMRLKMQIRWFLIRVGLLKPHC